MKLCIEPGCTKQHHGRGYHYNRRRRELAPKGCPYGDRFCPCQEGDACHYEDCGDSLAAPLRVLGTPLRDLIPIVTRLFKHPFPTPDHEVASELPTLRELWDISKNLRGADLDPMTVKHREGSIFRYQTGGGNDGQ